MSEEYRTEENIENTEYTEDTEYEEQEMPTQDDVLRERIEGRRRLIRKKQLRQRRLAVIGVILLFALLLTMCGREIIRLKADNYALKKQQEELREERDRLTRELKNVGNKEYIKEQARKQLRLLDPGEIMFIFDDGSDGDSGGDKD